LTSVTVATAAPLSFDTATRARVNATYGRLPLYFEANQGQTDPQVRFLARGGGHTLFLTPTEAVLVLTKQDPSLQAVLRMTFVGASPQAQIMGQREVAGKVNYFLGNDPAKWRTNVPTYAAVRYEELYQGIDLVYYGNNRELEYDLVVAPGADPSQIALSFQGADRLEVDAQGDLVLHTAVGPIHQLRPVIYQLANGVRSEVAGAYVFKGGNQIGFEVLAYDKDQPLVIDPVLLYSSQVGDYESGIAVDAAGNAYVTGNAVSWFSHFATPGAFQTVSSGPPDALVTKLSQSGSIVYSTYLGGSGYDAGSGIAVDTAGNAYIRGNTSSTDFPTTPGGFQPTLGGGYKPIGAMQDSNGSGLVYSTYLGGSGSEWDGSGIAVDAAGNAYVTGNTSSTDFPTTPGGFQPTSSGGGNKAFVTKLNPSGSGLVYSTYLGGSVLPWGSTGFRRDWGRGIAVDAAGYAYVTGVTNSADFPTTPGAFQTAISAQPGDFFSCGCNAFVTELNPSGSGLVYSTYLGGEGDDGASSIAIDSAGNTYITGTTVSRNFPTTLGAFQPVLGSYLWNTLYRSLGPDQRMLRSNAFVTKLNATGSALLYSTYLGGSGAQRYSETVGLYGVGDGGTGITVDINGIIHATGWTSSSDFPATQDAFHRSLAGQSDGFLTKLNPSLFGPLGLVFSTYLGGYGYGTGVAVDRSGDAYVVTLLAYVLKIGYP